MGFRKLLLRWGFLLIILFFLYTLLVSKELYQQFDFDFMVKLQNHIPRSLDAFLSVFSYLGEAYVTVGLAVILAIAAFFRKNILASVGWLGIIPATLVEVFGKMMVYHPPPSAEFLRTIKNPSIPNVYVPTDFSYPSGHVTRTTFLVVVALIILWQSKQVTRFKVIITLGLVLFIFLMILSRVSLGEHWLSDVLGGIILGSSLACFSSLLILSKKLEKNR